MNTCFLYILIIFACMSSLKLTEIQPIDIKSSQEAEINLDKKIVYNFTYAQLADYIIEKERIEWEKLLWHEFELRQRKERENEIYRKLLASRVKSSFIRDFLTTRY